MGQLEHKKIQEILSNMTENERLFRVPVGLFWTASPKETTTRTEKDGSLTVILRHARPIHGLPKGTSDLIGLTSVIITPDMVGQRVAVFTALEIKTEAYKKVTERQSNFGKMVELLGGIFKVVR